MTIKSNPEKTTFDRIRMAIGTALSIVGVLALLFASIFGFNLTLTFSAILFIVSGLMIAGSHRLAQLIAELLP